MKVEKIRPTCRNDIQVDGIFTFCRDRHNIPGTWVVRENTICHNNRCRNYNLCGKTVTIQEDIEDGRIHNGICVSGSFTDNSTGSGWHIIIYKVYLSINDLLEDVDK